MGLVTEYYLSSALEEIEHRSNQADQWWDNSTSKEYVESLLNYDLVEGEPVEYEDRFGDVREGEVVDRRPITNLLTGLNPENPTLYSVGSGGRTITVSEDDII